MPTLTPIELRDQHIQESPRGQISDLIKAITSPGFPGEPKERLVLAALFGHADIESGLAWPSLGLIAAETGVSPRTVQRAIDKLEDAGLVQRLHGQGRRSRGRWEVNTYEVIGQRIAEVGEGRGAAIKAYRTRRTGRGTRAA